MGGAKTIREIADEVRAEHLAAAAETPDNELLNWSNKVFEDMKETDKAAEAARAHFRLLDAARNQARAAFRRSPTPVTSTAWRESITASEEAKISYQNFRETLNRHRALSALLSSLIQRRRQTGGGAATQGPIDIDTLSNEKPPSSQEQNATSTTVESCPFCEHTYTVRDGRAPQTDAHGNRLQLRKCQCRERGVCKNCPICKTSPDIMVITTDTAGGQMQMCRDILECEICSCECPGAGKWVEADVESRLKYRERAVKRHRMLSTLLQASWSGGGPGGGSGGALYPNAQCASQPSSSDCDEGTSVTMLQGQTRPRHRDAHIDLPRRGRCVKKTNVVALQSELVVKRLPADIRDQIEAVSAAHGLLGGTVPVQSSGMMTTMGGRAERTGIIGLTAEEEDAGGGNRSGKRRRGNTCQPLPLPAHPSDQDVHIHRCTHPHEECTSDCCSATCSG